MTDLIRQIFDGPIWDGARKYLSEWTVVFFVPLKQHSRQRPNLRWATQARHQ
jgi:hypothetical protein